MDGIQDAFWDGDEVLWSNFIQHYCFCLLNAAAIVSVGGNSVSFGGEHILSRSTPDNLPEAPIRRLLEIFIESAKADKLISKLLSLLKRKRRLAKDELRFLLDIYHAQFLHLLAETLRKNGHIDFLSGLDLKPPATPIRTITACARFLSSSMLNLQANVTSRSSAQLHLQAMYENQHQFSQDGIAKQNIITLLTSYPALYLDACVKAIYDEYYIACFTEKNDDAAMWGHYASGHRGICLIFEFEEQDGKIYLEMEENQSLELYKVQYSSEPPTVNVFEGLGYLPQMSLHRHWLSLGQKLSALASKYSSPDYPAEYWQKYVNAISHKFPEWQREHEHRAVKSAWCSDRKNSQERLMHYKESHLKGIIFGMRTSQQMILEIMSAVDSSLSDIQKANFEFHRAEYCSAKKTLTINRLNLLKFS